MILIVNLTPRSPSPHSTRVRSAAEDVFSDVMEEFSELSLIASHFEAWKRTFPRAYNDAYVGLSFRKIVRPLISLEVRYM